MERLSKAEYARFANCPVRCPKLKERVNNLADFFVLGSTAVRSDDTFWFRGHYDVQHTLVPSALRDPTLAARRKALNLMPEFTRVAEMKLPRPPHRDEKMEWAQLAQHYGLPTRLLDWTESATTALFFACLRGHLDGLVFVLNPVDLNRVSYPGRPRILDPQNKGDCEIIRRYLALGPQASKRGRFPIAVNPVWNSERLMMQRGVFTLHGSRFEIDPSVVPSLVAIPILKEVKHGLREELQRIGVDEMTLFPELEHACIHLRRRAGLKTGTGLNDA
jgi:hypothetical protein